MTEEEKLRRAVEQDRLLRKARAGDAGAFEQLMEMHTPMLMRLFRSKAWTPQDAEDLLQQTRIVAYFGLNSIRETEKFSLWLLNVARILCLNYFSRDLAKRDKDFPLHLPAYLTVAEMQQSDESTRPYGSVEYRLLAEALYVAAERVCTETELRILKLALTGATDEQASRTLKMNHATVRSHLLRGRQKLLAYLVVHQPDLFGGADAIQEAIRQLAQDTAPQDRPEVAEMAALAHHEGPTGRIKEFRKFIARLVRYLPLPLLALVLRMGGDR